MNPPETPLPVAQVARALGVHRTTLWRALRADPGAPEPDARDVYGKPMYRYEAVAAWWPKRRRPGRPWPEKGA